MGRRRAPPLRVHARPVLPGPRRPAQHCTSHRAGAWEGSGAEDETHSTLSLCRSLNLKEMEPNHTGLHSPCFSSES